MLGYLFVKDLRERDGIPDLRRAARFRYASVTLPEVSSGILVSFSRYLTGKSSLEGMNYNLQYQKRSLENHI